MTSGDIQLRRAHRKLKELTKLDEEYDALKTSAKQASKAVRSFAQQYAERKARIIQDMDDILK